MTSKQLFISLLFLSSNVPSIYGITSPPEQRKRDADLNEFYMLDDEPTTVNLGQAEAACAQSCDEDNNNTNLVWPHEDWEMPVQEQPIYSVPQAEAKNSSDDNNNNNNATLVEQDDKLPASADEALPIAAAKKSVPKDTDISSEETKVHVYRAITNEQSSSARNRCLRKVLLRAGGPVLAGSVGLSVGVIVFRIVRSYWQRNQINKILYKYGKSLSTINSDYANVIIAAYNNDNRMVHQWLDKHGKDVIQHDRWIIAVIGDFYFGKQYSK